MFPEQKSKPSNLSNARLILTAVGLISLITILGVAEYLKKNKEIINSQPQVSITLEPINSISDLKIYRNEKYEFELKYPQEFTFKSTGPNISQQAIDNGEQIAGTVAPSLDTIIFSGKNNEVEGKFYVDIFHPDKRQLSIENYNDYLYVYGSCDIRRGFEPLTKVIKKINNIDVLEIDGRISEGLQKTAFVGCNYFKNHDNNIIVLSTDRFESEVDFNKANITLHKIFSTLVSKNAESIIDLKIYRNEKYGFEFKYPKDYSIFQEADQKTGETIPSSPESKKIFITNEPKMFFCCEPAYLSVEILDTYITDFKKWIDDKKIIHSENNYRVKMKGDINFNGEQAYQIQADCGIDSPGNIVLVNHDSKTYYIRYDDETRLASSEKILSTFKFIEIEKNETADWQTYSNEKYGFELFFPESWKGVRRVISKSEGIETILFELPTLDKTWENGSGFSSLFSLNIELKENWLKTGLAKDIHPPYLFENDKYVFEFDIIGNRPEDLLDVDVLDIISTFHLIDKVSFGSLSAYTKRETAYNYVILSEGGKETIVNKGTTTYNEGVNGEWGPVWFGGPSFSPKGNYLLYGAGMHEAGASFVYDIKNKKNVLIVSDDSSGLGFTPNEKYFYACSWAGMGSEALGNIYAVPSFKIIYNALSSLNSYGGASCRYDLKTDSIIYYHKINTVDNDIVDIIRYSLKEQKEYRLDKEIDNEESLQGE